MRAFEDAVTLNQVQTFEGNRAAGMVGVFQQHEFSVVAAVFDLAKALELADAVIHMDDVVAGLQLGKIAEEAGSTNLAAGALDGGGDVEEIGVAEKRKPGIEKRDAFGEKRANQQHGGGFLRAFGGKSSSGGRRFAQEVGDFGFAAAC